MMLTEDSKKSLGGTVAAAQQALKLCGNSFTKPPDMGCSRIYKSSMVLNWKACSFPRANHKRFRYEISCRFDSGAATSRTGHIKMMREGLNKGTIFACADSSTPADYIEKLARVEPKHTARPSWATFNFLEPTRRLAAWLSMLTWEPNAKLSKLADLGKARVAPLSSFDRLQALNSDAVFISSSVFDFRASGAFWALTLACTEAGARVATDWLPVNQDAQPKVEDVSGVQLWRDILDALRILAELYDRAGDGAAFAYAFFCGLHYPSTVVGHSDEGGLIRDAVREGAFPAPHGGLPNSCPYSVGLPTIGNTAYYSELAAIVDSYLLRSAAAVAHCAPLTQLPDGSSRPVIIQGTLEDRWTADPPQVIPGNPQSQVEHDNFLAGRKAAYAEHVAVIRRGVYSTGAKFCSTWIRALAALLGLSTTEHGSRAIETFFLEQLTSVLEEPSNRHLTKGNHIAPFFWVEPTTLLPWRAFGTEAEQAGWASYGYSDETREMPFLPDAVEVDRPRGYTHYYEIKLLGARCSPWLLALQGHADDGLAAVHFQRMDPQDLVCVGGEASRIGVDEAWERKLSVDRYLWVRGQSGLPHPCEMLHAGSYAVIGIKHYNEATDDWHCNIPAASVIRDCVVRASFMLPCGVEYGIANRENRREYKSRTRGQYALSELAGRLVPDEYQSTTDGGHAKVRVARATNSITRVPARSMDPLTRPVHEANEERETLLVPSGPKPVAESADTQKGRGVAHRVDMVYTAAPVQVPKPAQPAVSTGAAAVQPQNAPAPTGAANAQDGHGADGAVAGRK